VPTRASTTATLPPASRIRLRCSARRWAARLAASFSRLVLAFARAALPMRFRPFPGIYYLRT